MLRYLIKKATNMFVFNLYKHVHCIPNNVRSFIYNERIIKILIISFDKTFTEKKETNVTSRSTTDIVISGL